MHFLRRSTFLARLVLAWFVLSLGVAVAAPLLAPQDIHQVCTSSGAVVRMADLPSDDSTLRKAMECPLCVPAAAPPVPLPALAVPDHPLAYATPGFAAAIRVVQTTAPLPARGPPSV